MKPLIAIAFFFSSFIVVAQEKYVTPTDPLVQTKIGEWQDLKFGLHALGHL